MLTNHAIKHFVELLLAATIAVSASLFVQAQETSYSASFKTETKDPIAINVLVGQSRVINFDQQIGRFSISNPEVAEAVMVTPTQVLVNGKGFGQVNFIAWERSGDRYVVFDVYVRANLSLIDSQIRALFPKDDIRLSQANGSVVLSGTVMDPQSAQQADNVVQAAGFKTVNMLQSPVTNMAQVQLNIRVAEVSRQKLRDVGSSYASVNAGTAVFAQGGGPGTLGSDDKNRAGVVPSLTTEFVGSAVNLFLFNTGLNTAAFIRALKTNGALRALAEPNLIAMNGQQASFLAGGEFPVPVVQGGAGSNTVSIVFKEYGVRLNFKPTIIDEDHIRLELEPEVSSIDFANGVRFGGFVIPALRTRRARTGVELRDGQSFALAGLLDNNETRSVSKIPGLGDIPILGNLFKSSSFQRNETELMFIVTAQLVKPVNRDDLPNLRGIDGLKQGSPLGVEPKDEGIKGSSGYSTGGTDTTTPAQPNQKEATPKPTSAPATSTGGSESGKPTQGAAAAPTTKTNVDATAKQPPIEPKGTP